MTEQGTLPATNAVALPAQNNETLLNKTVILLLKKKSIELKLTVKGSKSITVEVLACKDVSLAVATTIARVQEQLLRAEAICYRGTNFPAHLLIILDKQGWNIQALATPD